MQQPMTGTVAPGRPLASLPQRFLGQVLDGAVAFGLAIAAQVLLPAHPIVAPALLFVAYVLFADGLPGGQSLGKKLLGVEVIDANTGRPCSWGQSFLRNFLLAILGPIDWVFIFGERHQRLGDRAAGTVVAASVPRGWPAAGWHAPAAGGWTPPTGAPGTAGMPHEGTPPSWAPQAPVPPSATPAMPGSSDAPASPPRTWMPPARPAQEPKMSYSSREHAARQAPPSAATPASSSAPVPSGQSATPDDASSEQDNPLAPRDPAPPKKGNDWMPF